MIRQVASVDDIVRHDNVKFLDNNFLALPNRKKILKELIEKKIKCEFNQGLDIRLLDSKNSYLLSKLRYYQVYTFAFDNVRQHKVIDRKIKLLSWRSDWQIRFFVYVAPSMKISDTVRRVAWLRKKKCLPYIMRDVSRWGSLHEKFYTDIAGWCNWPILFKNCTFTEYMKLKNYKDKFRLRRHSKMWRDKVKSDVKIKTRKAKK